MFDEKNIDLDKPLSYKVLLAEWTGMLTYIANNGKDFVFKTNIDAPMNRVVKLNIDSPEKKNWIELIPEDKRSVLSTAFWVNKNQIAT